MEGDAELQSATPVRRGVDDPSCVGARLAGHLHPHFFGSITLMKLWWIIPRLDQQFSVG